MANMAGPVFSSTLPYKVRCCLPDCQKPVNHVFRREMDGAMLNFCSPYHAQTGEKRWKEKQQRNMSPQTAAEQKHEEFVGSNIEDFQE